MIVLGIDIETGASFDAPIEENFITELGAVLWDTDSKKALDIFSTLVKDARRISPEAELYTGITQDDCDKYGIPLDKVKNRFNKMLEKAEVAVTHNGTAFDLKVLEANDLKVRMLNIDTMIDIEYPANCKSKNLTYLQGFHQFCYPGHRAIFDVMAMLRIMGMYDLSKILLSANSPLVKVQALVDFHTKEKAKKFGFNWDGKIWSKQIKKFKLESDSEQWDFKFKILE